MAECKECDRCHRLGCICPNLPAAGPVRCKTHCVEECRACFHRDRAFDEAIAVANEWSDGSKCVEFIIGKLKLMKLEGGG